MSGNRSLDEFVGDDESTDSSAVEADPDAEPSPESTATTGDDGPVGTVAADPVDPGRSSSIDPKAETFSWTPDGASCANCGGTAEVRWRDGDALVCIDCKSW